MRILVTGANGLLGSNVVRVLLDKGHEVSILLRDKNKPVPTLGGLTLTRYYGDILDAESLEDAVAGVDYVIHAAAFIHINPARSAQVKKVNIEGTKNIIEACIRQNVKRLIYIGTANSFGSGPIENPGTEENIYKAGRFGFDYMDSKRTAQELVLKAVRERQLPAIILNPTMMIGPYDSRPTSGAMVLAIYQRKIPSCPPGGRNYIAVKDVAAAVVKSLTMGRVGECYILGNHNLSYHEAFQRIAKVIGVKAPGIRTPRALVMMFGIMNSSFSKVFRFKPHITKEIALLSCECDYYNSAKARKELDLSDTSFEVAVKDCFEWFKANNYLNR
ncbi:MAG: NAD-dependent epimerase/dehydratase family protein [Bacteroidales bacterium]